MDDDLQSDGCIDTPNFRLNSSMQEHGDGHLPLHKAFFAPFRLIEEGGIDPVIRGLFGSSAKLPSPETPMNNELTEKLFKLAHAVALGNLASVPIYNMLYSLLMFDISLPQI